MYSLDEVKSVDPEIASCIIKEEERQNSHIELIASENWVSKAVILTFLLQKRPSPTMRLPIS